MSTIEKAAARLVRKRVDGAQERANSNNKNDNVVVDAMSTGASSIPMAKGSVADESVLEYSKSCELNFSWLAENGFLVPNHTNHKQSQQFRRIKRPLLVNLQSQIADSYLRPTNVIYVTSALPSEGKTFVALNLALSLAGEVDRSVLLLDGDVAKGDLSRWLGIYDEPGLVDLLSEGSDAAEAAVIETNVDRLAVMSCGKHRENLDELYASELMTRMVDELADRVSQRIIVVDGPPLVPTTEAAVLAGLMGQTVMVVEANQTPQAAVEQAIDQLKGSQLVSMLLNKVPDSQSEGYGYGYGYGYGRDTGAANTAAGG